ncbi:response regulator transcription factor [Clostridium sp.]
MFSLLIVDDEIISRIGVTHLLNWREYGFEVVDSVSNGQEAIEIMRRQHIDLVITDIKMPMLSGIQLIQISQKEKLNATFIVLSAFNDYEYVREALKLGAIDYILKLDLDEKHMKYLLEKVKECISTRTDKNERIEIVDKQTLKIERRNLVKQLLFQQVIFDEKFEKQCKDLFLRLPYEKNVVIMFETNKVGNCVNNEGIMDIVEDVLCDYEYSYICDTGFNQLSVLYNIHYINESQLTQTVKELARRINYILKQYFNQKVIIHISQKVDSMDKLSCAYMQTCNDRDMNSFMSDSEYIYCTDVINNQSSMDYAEFEGLIKRLELVYNNKSDESIQIIFVDIYAYIHGAEHIEKWKVKYFLSSLVHITNKYIDRLGYSRQVIWGDEEHEYQMMQKINDKDDFLNSLEFLEEKLTQINCDNCDNYIIRMAKKYLKQNYTKGIIIKEMADELSITNTYLSTLFSTKTGVTIKGYLICLQIERAKCLLRETNLQIGEIANAVGYENEHYFSRIFKQKTNQTPTQYRN